jgi:hypothetical protein
MTATHMTATHINATGMTVTFMIAILTSVIRTIADAITEVFFGCNGFATRAMKRAITDATTTATNHAPTPAMKRALTFAREKKKGR